ncbi:MAG: hypothetical protein A2283_14420 [Lentisphaerae bacterium RIFOXYA12_FULL_48_11]|nr:MAG: hypothetical protein A2283_14420 [Lentisphaerae bacterium RIFOXYA12_FULL_48_11]
MQNITFQPVSWHFFVEYVLSVFAPEYGLAASMPRRSERSRAPALHAGLMPGCTKQKDDR